MDELETTPEPRALPTIGDNFMMAVALIAEAKKNTRPVLKEETLLKIWELGLMWALNNRQTTQNQFFDPEVDGGEGDEPMDQPVPDEIITAAEED